MQYIFYWSRSVNGFNCPPTSRPAAWPNTGKMTPTFFKVYMQQWHDSGTSHIIYYSIAIRTCMSGSVLPFCFYISASPNGSLIYVYKLLVINGNIVFFSVLLLCRKKYILNVCQAETDFLFFPMLTLAQHWYIIHIIYRLSYTLMEACKYIGLVAPESPVTCRETAPADIYRPKTGSHK